MALSFVEQLITLLEEDQYPETLLAPVLEGSPILDDSLDLPSEAETEHLEELVGPSLPIENETGISPTSQAETYIPEDDNEFNFIISLSLNANFSKSAEDIFKLLNSSILHGEYLALTEIEEIEKKLDTACKTFIQKLKDQSVDHGRYFNSLNIYFKVIERAIKDFINLTNSLNLKVKTKKVYYTINGDNNLSTDEFKYLNDPDANETLNKNCLKQYRLFNINLAASRNEFLMQSVDFEKLLSELLIDIKWISEIEDHLLLSDAIKWKCLYLEFKIKARITHESGNDIVFSDGVKELPLQDIRITPFKIWNEAINRHYELEEESKNEIKQRIQDRNLVTTELDLIDLVADIHLLIKYYKDCAENAFQDELKLIRENIGLRYKNAKQNQGDEQFDAFAYGFSYNYAINNEFSAIIGKEKSTDEKLPDYQIVKSLYQEICKIQEKTGIDNFFPQYRYLQYLIRKIKYDLQKDIKSHKLENILSLVKEAKAIFKRYHKNIYWTQNTYNYVFYLPKAECSVNFVDAAQIITKIFVASSFVLPLGKDRYILEYNQLEIELTNLERAIEMVSIINDEQKEISDKNNELADDLKGKETKYIEILGIFGAVITFASAAFTTQLSLSKGESPNSITNGMISVGLVLFFFILLIVIITRFPLEKVWKSTERLGMRKFGVAVIFGIVFCAVSAVLSTLYTNYQSNMISEEFGKKQDSIISKQNNIIKLQNKQILKNKTDSISFEKKLLFKRSKN